jgi:nucleoid DNA-binding protein
LNYASLDKPKFSEDMTEEQAKKEAETLRNSRKDLQQKVQWSLTLGVPFLFAGFGLFRWNVRQSRKQRTSKTKG